MRSLTLVGAGLFAALAGFPDAEAVARGDQAAALRAAAEALASAAPSGDSAKPLTEIVGVLAAVGEKAGLPADQRARLRAAHSGLQKDGWSAEPAARVALNEVYAAQNGGQQFRFPGGVLSIEQARQAYRRELDRAVAALEKQRPAEAVKPILELLMLVSTPMEGH